MESILLKHRLLSCLLLSICLASVLSTPSYGDWKSDANARIEQYRKGNLEVIVQDFHGNPIEGAEVHVAMKKHAFGFGSAVDASYLLNNGYVQSDGSYTSPTPDGAKYVEYLTSLFNITSLEDEMKWPWESLPHYASRTVPWLMANGLEVRGHNLIWSKDGELPADVRNSTDPEYIRTRARDRCYDYTAQYAGKVTHWDVLNEPIHFHELEDKVGYAERVQWFQLARAADPDAKLYVNDYNVLSDSSASTYVSAIQNLINQGAPIDGVGMQGHFHDLWYPPSASTIWSRMQTIASLGLEMEITEFDMGNGMFWTSQAKTDFLEMVMTLSFSHPQMRAFIMWGFWDGEHWLGDAPIFEEDWTLKQSGQKYLDLVFDQWWTDETGCSNQYGEMNVRGFLGDYEISASFDGQVVSQSFTLGNNGGTVVFTVPEPSTISLLICSVVAMFIIGVRYTRLLL